MKREFFLAAAVSVALAGCGQKRERAELPSLPAATVRVQVIESKPRTATEDVVGTVRAKLRSVIEAKISGKIQLLPVVPGQQVKAGDLLATIDAREVQARFDQAVAVRQQADADLKRLTSLFEQKIASQADFDNAARHASRRRRWAGCAGGGACFAPSRTPDGLGLR